MIQFLLGTAAGFLASWMSSSARAREAARRRLSTLPQPVREAAHSAATAAGGGTQRLIEAIDSAPLPEPVKSFASSTAQSMQSAAQAVADAAGSSGAEILHPTEAEIAGRPAEPLPRIEPEGTPL